MKRRLSRGALSADKTPENPPARTRLDPLTESPLNNSADGKIETDPFVVFLFLVLRDHVQPGDIEQRVMEIEESIERKTFAWELTNGHLAGYAKELMERLSEGMDHTAATHEKRLSQAEGHVRNLLRTDLTIVEWQAAVSTAERFIALGDAHSEESQKESQP